VGKFLPVNNTIAACNQRSLWASKVSTEETFALAITNLTPGKSSSPAAALPVRARERTDPNGDSIRSVILLSIPDDEFALIRPQLEPVDLPQHRILHDPGGRIDYGYFMNDGMISQVVLTNDGRSVEVGIVGREGMEGMPLIVGMRRGLWRGIVQIAGDGVRLRAEVLERVLPVSPHLLLELNRFSLLHGLQVAQIAACNRLHDIEQRLARWLLMCQDRVDTPTLNLTHEFLAQMLGTGRPSVSLASGRLEQTGIIENFRGTVKIINRKRLEAVACECYGVVQNFNGGLGLR
jgi:CRP-like cAMP-binding protein